MIRLAQRMPVPSALRAVAHRIVAAPLVAQKISGPAIHLASDWLAYHAPSDSLPIVDLPTSQPIELRFGDGSPCGLFPVALREAYLALVGTSEDRDPPCLLYVHRGHNAEAKTPILQKLLRALCHDGPAYALRTHSPEISVNELEIARVLVSSHRRCLVLHDPVDRLTLGIDLPPSPPSLTLTLTLHEPPGTEVSELVSKGHHNPAGLLAGLVLPAGLVLEAGA